MLICAWVLVVAAGRVLAAEVAAPAHPNVLFIAVDDLNHWVGHLHRNPQTITPNIDRLAAMGVTFTQAHSPAPACNPARTAVMSGLRPGATGIYNNAQEWRPVIPEALTLTTQFRNAGYYVAGAGKIYHASAHRPGEWDDYLVERDAGEPCKFAAAAKDDGVGTLKFAPLACSDRDMRDYRIAGYGVEQLTRDHDRPFFLAIGLHAPHLPWNVPKKYYDMHPLALIELPPYRADDLDDIPPSGIRLANPTGEHAAVLRSGRWKEAVQAYLAAITFSDAMVGRLLEALQRSAYRDTTIIVLWSDQGWHLGEKHHWRKFTLWDETTHIPFIWVVPGVTKSGGVCQRTVDLMSVYPTLCDLAGVPIPAHVHGRSLRPLLANPQAAWDVPAIITSARNSHAVRSEGFRYIHYADGSEELYDERADPYEWRNLAANPQYAAIKAQLTTRLPAENKPGLPHTARGAGASPRSPR